MKRSDALRQFSTFWPIIIIALLWPAAHLVQNPAIVDPYFGRIICLIGLNISLAVSLQLINGISGQFSLGHAGFMSVGAYMAAYPATALLIRSSEATSSALNNPFAPLLFFVDVALAAIILSAVLGAFAIVFRFVRRMGNWPLAAALVVVASWVLFDFAHGSGSEGTPPIYLVFSSLAYWTRLGFTWILEAGLPVTRTVSSGLPVWLGEPLTGIVLLLGGGFFAAIAGLFIGIPVLRLRGDYLAIATLGFAEIIAVIINNSQPLGGALGMSDIPRFAGFGWIYALATITCIAVWRLGRSARGRAMIAVREDEIAASAIGIDPARTRILALVVGAFLAGMAGALFAHFEGYITPRHFSFMRSIELVVMVTLAGAGSITGTILAAIVLTLLPELLRGFSEWRMVVYSLLLITMMLVRPNGLLGGKEIGFRWRKRSDAPA